MYFSILGVLCTINCYFEYRIRVLCLLLYMGTYLKDIVRFFSTFFGFPVPEVLTIFVQNICLIIWGIWGPNAPPPTHPHPRRQCLRSLPREKIIEKNAVLMISFFEFYETH